MTSLAIKTPEDKNMPWLKSYPKEVSWDIDIAELPLFTLFDNIVEKYGENDALDFAGYNYSYNTLSNIINRTAAGLQKLGVKKGIKVGLFMPNSAYSVIVYYAILKSGGTVVNYNPAYVEHDLIHQVEDSETDILVTLDMQPLIEKTVSLLEKSRVNKIILCPAKEDITKTTKTLGITDHLAETIWFCDLINNDGDFVKPNIDFKNDIAVLQYTGGTTGTPKGAALSHQNVTSNAVQAQAWYYNAKSGEDSMIAVLPLFHVFAMTAVMNFSMIHGLKLFIVSQFDMKEILKLISEKKANYISGVPTMYMALANYDRISEFDFSSLKFCLSGGAPLPAEVKKAFETRTGANLVAEGYGLTEFSPVATCNPISSKAKAGSIGIALPRTTVEILSTEDGVTILATGEKGEICVSGPQMMLGYYNAPEETAKVIKNGKLHTGDIGYMDDNGFTYIVDRMKDLILVGGYNVYPRNIEEAIYSHPAVHECIVAGVPDKLRGEVPYAWIKPLDGKILEANTIRAFLQGKISSTEMPKKIFINEEPLPKTAVGKLSKKDLLKREGYA